MYVAEFVCCTSLQRAEDVVHQLRRRLLIMIRFKKLRQIILSSEKEYFTILINDLCQLEREK